MVPFSGLSGASWKIDGNNAKDEEATIYSPIQVMVCALFLEF
jgi:hypothetical protein